MERYVTHEKIIIAGDGISGLNTAIELQKVGFTVEIYAPETPHQAEITWTMPLISTETAKLLNLSIPTDYQITTVDASFSISGITPLDKQDRTDNPLYAIKMKDIVRQLRDHANASGIPILPGKVTGIIFDANRVCGVVANEKEIPATLVIDATGQPAHLSKLVSETFPEAISEISHAEPSGIIGMYVDLRNQDLRTSFPKASPHVLHIGILPGETSFLVAPLVPSPEPGSAATHLLLIEGSQQTIRDAYGKTETSTNDSSAHRLRALQELAQQTTLATITDQITTNAIETTLLFFYKAAVFRNVCIPGFVAVGDAQGYNNPIFGKGIKSAVKDTITLRNALLQYPYDINRALPEYRNAQTERYTEGFEASQQNFLKIQQLYVIYNLMSGLQR